MAARACLTGVPFYLVNLVVVPILIVVVYGLHMVSIVLSLATRLFATERKQLVVRTPEENFSNLHKLGYTFKPNYVELPIGGGKTLPRLHYVDEGPRDAAETILCIHGEPTWSFLYRYMIPHFVAAGYRVIAPDFIGLGKSDKYVHMESYSHDLHMMSLRLLLDHLQLSNVTIVGQDWGGVYTCSVLKDCPELFSRLVVMNTTCTTGFISKFTPWIIAHAMPVILFQAIVKLCGKWIPVGLVMRILLKNNPSEEVIQGYTAPFPSALYKAGEANWSLNLPILPGGALSADMMTAQDFLKDTWKNPTLIMFSDCDDLSTSWICDFERLLPGAQKKTIKGIGHFLQEEAGEEVARNIISFVEGKL